MIELLMDGIHLSFWWIMDHLLIINIILSILIIFFQRRNPTTVWTWLLVLYFIPGLGFILYLVLGQNFHKDRMFRMKERLNMPSASRENPSIGGNSGSEIPSLTGTGS